MFLKIGHRGAKGLVTENTLESFETAIKFGVNAIEFDVRATKDKKILIMHDENLKRVWGLDFYIKDLTLKEIKNISDKIPTLEEAIDYLKNKVEKILIEIKEPGFEKSIVEKIKKYKIQNKAIIISFEEEILKKIDKSLERGLIYLKHQNPFKAVKELEVDYVLPFYRFASQKVIEVFHKMKVKVLVWTINDKKTMIEYIKRKVDGIATDFPNLFKEEEIENLMTKVEQRNLHI